MNTEKRKIASTIIEKDGKYAAVIHWAPLSTSGLSQSQIQDMVMGEGFITQSPFVSSIEEAKKIGSKVISTGMAGIKKKMPNVKLSRENEDFDS